MQSSASSRYTTVAILLHWIMAALILFMIWLGWNMEDNVERFQLHKSIGITILVLTVARVLWRWINPPPPLPAEIPPRDKMLAELVQRGFYALMVLLPLLGWFLVSTAKKEVPTLLFGVVRWPHLPFTASLRGGTLHEVAEFLHSKGAWVMIILLALHVAGAVKHEISAEEGVLKRMLPGLFGQVKPPARRGHGFFTAFGGALAFFGIIAAAPLLKGTPETPPLTEPQLETSTEAGTATLVPNWDIDPATSEIRFSGIYEGNQFTGTFQDWTAAVHFDPDDLPGSVIEVQVKPGTAKTGNKLYDDSLKEGEWFDAETYPVAKVHLGKFEKTDDGYRAEATLLLKEHAASMPLNFHLTIDGDTATFDGKTVFSRKVLDLGQSSDPGGDWINDAVTVSVKGTATRK
ncbi:MAG TPA: cytochrome b/b6 domain-containing protein [Hyphomonas sp.]|nr:cytochrome b/b6 domain-containing protein [Hyphomonas sp.]